MERSEFYNRLDTALAAFGFSPKVTAVKMVNSMGWMPKWAGSNVSGAEQYAKLVPMFEPMQSCSTGVSFKFFLGQPVVACSVDADDRSPSEMLGIATTFQNCLLSATSHTLRGTFFNTQTGGVFGMLLFVFFDAQKAAQFVYSTQSQCHLKLRRKKTFVRPWAIDVATRKVVPDHQGWFKNVGPLKPDRLAESLFTHAS